MSLLRVSNIAYNLSHRSVLISRENRELKEEKKQVATSSEEKKQVATSSKEKVDDLEKCITLLKAQLSDLEKNNKELQQKNKKLDADLITAVSRESKSLQLIEQLRSDALDARRKGEKHGRNSALVEKDEEFRRSMPQIQLQAMRDFVHSPVLNAANVWLGSNDLMAGWNRAIGQVKTLGAQFDEGMLDIFLDEDLQSTEEEEEELHLNFRGHEFESIMDDVKELQKKFDKKQAAAEEKKKRKKTAAPVFALEAPPPVEGAEMIEALQIDAGDEALEGDVNKSGEPGSSQAQ